MTASMLALIFERPTEAEIGGAKGVFQVSSGTYRVIGASTELLRIGGGQCVGGLENIDPATVFNLRTGQGIF
jgi:hypothetical protein